MTKVICFLIGHNMYVAKDDKSVYCKRCKQGVGYYKKGYAEIGMGFLKKENLLYGIILDPKIWLFFMIFALAIKMFI